MIDVLYDAARLGCRPTQFLEMVRPHRGLATAHQLIAANKVHDGFAELFLLGRLDLMVGYKVLLAEYSPLFTDEERRVARTRLGVARFHEGPR